MKSEKVCISKKTTLFVALGIVFIGGIVFLMQYASFQRPTVNSRASELKPQNTINLVIAKPSYHNGLPSIKNATTLKSVDFDTRQSSVTVEVDKNDTDFIFYPTANLKVENAIFGITSSSITPAFSKRVGCSNIPAQKIGPEYCPGGLYLYISRNDIINKKQFNFTISYIEELNNPGVPAVKKGSKTMTLTVNLKDKVNTTRTQSSLNSSQKVNLVIAKPSYNNGLPSIIGMTTVALVDLKNNSDVTLSVSMKKEDGDTLVFYPTSNFATSNPIFTVDVVHNDRNDYPISIGCSDQNTNIDPKSCPHGLYKYIPVDDIKKYSVFNIKLGFYSQGTQPITRYNFERQVTIRIVN